MMRVFVYEHLSGAGAAVDDDELLAAGRAMRDAVVRDLLAADCAVSVVAEAADMPIGAQRISVPPGTSAFEVVAGGAASHDRVWVIAPETGGVLASLHRAAGASRWLGCSDAAIALTSSKRATLARVAAHGMPTPLAFAAAPAGGRWIVKPDDGAGALATQVHATLGAAHRDAESRQRRGEPATLEAFVDGEPMSVSLLCGDGGAELLSVNRQVLTIDAGGGLSFSGVEIDALRRGDARFGALQRWSQTLDRAVPGLRGYVGVDLVWHAQRGPVLIEVNPRVTMAYVGLSTALGRNLAAAVLAVHEREDAAHVVAA